MSPMFGGKKRAGKTVALVDIESGSVGAALAHLSRGEAPKLFAETRVSLPLLNSRDAAILAREVERALDQALLHVSSVAARLRAHEAVAPQGEVTRAAVFFSPPWATMHLSGGTADFIESMRRSAHLAVRSTVGEVPTSFHPFGTAAAHGTVLLLPEESPRLVCMMHGEVCELLITTPQAVHARATVPVGQRTLVRTLVTHGGVSPHEVHSFLSLPDRSSHRLTEPLVAAEDHLVREIAEAAALMRGSHSLGGIVVVAHEPHAESIAQALARQESLAALFPEGGTVRALRATHAMPYIAAHARTPDLHLMLEALFINAKFAPHS